MPKSLQYDVRCYDLPRSLAADYHVNAVASDPTGTLIWRYRISCQGEKTFSALMQQLEIQRIAYDVKIIAPLHVNKKVVKQSLVSLKPLFLSLILVAIVSLAVIWAFNSPEAHQWTAELQQKMDGMIGSLVKQEVPKQ